MRRIALAMVVTCGAAFGQAADAKQVFEVATIKASAPPDGRGMTVGCKGGPGSPDPGRWSCQNLSLSNMITNAHNLKRYEISSPSWLDEVRFDITAKIPEGTTKEQFLVMRQNLLEERFKLVFHREQKEMAGYELAVAKNGPKVKEAVEEAPKTDGAPGPPPGRIQLDKDGYPKLTGGTTMAIMNGRARWQGKGAMDLLAITLGGQLSRPVVDATGLTGKYDMSLFWDAGGLQGGDGESGPTLFSALQDQLGLKLESKKVMVSVLVVDQVEKAPTEN